MCKCTAKLHRLVKQGALPRALLAGVCLPQQGQPSRCAPMFLGHCRKIVLCPALELAVHAYTMEFAMWPEAYQSGLGPQNTKGRE